MSDQPVNNGRSTKDVGLEARQQEVSEGQPLDSSWRARGPTMVESDLLASAQNREMQEDEATRAAYRKIRNILEEDDSGSGGASTNRPQHPSLSMNDLMEGLSEDDMQQALGIDRVARDLVHDGYRGSDNEAAMFAESYSAKPSRTEGAWNVNKMSGKLRSGKTVPVWKVVDEDTGMEFPTPFRIQAPADRIATILNSTGNVNDRRVKRVVEAYNQHVQLMKGVRQARQKIKEGQKGYKKRLYQLQDELEQVNVILGI